MVNFSKSIGLFQFFLIFSILNFGCTNEVRKNLETLKAENFSPDYRLAIVVFPLRSPNWELDSLKRKPFLETSLQNYLKKRLPSNPEIIQAPETLPSGPEKFEYRLIKDKRFQSFDGVYIIRFNTDNPRIYVPDEPESKPPGEWRDVGEDILESMAKRLLFGPEPTNYIIFVDFEIGFYSFKEKKLLYSSKSTSSCESLDKNKLKSEDCMKIHIKTIKEDFINYLEFAEQLKVN